MHLAERAKSRPGERNIIKKRNYQGIIKLVIFETQPLVKEFVAADLLVETEELLGSAGRGGRLEEEVNPAPYGHREVGQYTENYFRELACYQ